MFAATFAWWEIPVGLAGSAILVWTAHRWVLRRYGMNIIDEIPRAIDRWVADQERESTMTDTTEWLQCQQCPGVIHVDDYDPDEPFDEVLCPDCLDVAKEERAGSR